MHTYYGPSTPMIYVAGGDLFRYKNQSAGPPSSAQRDKNRCDLHFYARCLENSLIFGAKHSSLSNEGERFMLFVRPIL